MLLRDLLPKDEILRTQTDTCLDFDIIKITHRQEEICEGCLFVCFGTLPCDLESANSAVAILIDKEPHQWDLSVPWVLVTSCRRSYAIAYERFLDFPSRKLTVIGVTGTNGKTSTAFMLGHILRCCGYRTAFLGTIVADIDGTPYIAPTDEQNARLTTMTTPDPDILYPFLDKATRAGVTHVVMEVSSHALYYDKVSPIQFKEAIFTNLSPEHLDFHPSMEAYAQTKRKLFLRADHATINVDDACGKSLVETLDCPITTCGCLWNGDAMASQIKQADGKTCYFYSYESIRNIVSVPIPTLFSVYNSILALTSAIYLGVKPHMAVAALEHLPAIKGRVEKIDIDADIDIYIDYAHTEFALRNILQSIRPSVRESLILVFGCGGDRDPSKRAPMGASAAENADYTYITSDNSRRENPLAIITQILEGHKRPVQRSVIVDRRQAIETAILNAAPGDTILIVGKGHETYEVQGISLTPFDEREIIRSAIEKRKHHAH